MLILKLQSISWNLSDHVLPHMPPQGTGFSEGRGAQVACELSTGVVGPEMFLQHRRSVELPAAFRTNELLLLL